MLRLAGAVRDAGLAASGRPGVITYSRKVFIPLTTLCRDRCHYCIFVDTPAQLLKLHKPTYMSPEQVLTVARQGAALGCKEALLTLGDRPEDRWPEARAWLDEHGYASTLDYVGAMARLITAETGLLAHLNPGVMTADELRMLRPTAPSMGMMLETTSRRLFEEPGQVHYGSPDKDPDLRLAVIEDAGRERVPFTTGILVGIGETLRDRAESLIAIRASHEAHAVDGRAGDKQGHVQEVIVQNFRAKPRTAMHDAPDASVLEYVAAVAVARLVHGAAHARAGASEPLGPGRVRAAAAGRRRRLGRRLAADRRPREPRATVAAPDRPCDAHRRARLRAARAADGTARVRPACRDLDRPGAVARRLGSRRPCHRAGCRHPAREITPCSPDHTLRADAAGGLASSG